MIERDTSRHFELVSKYQPAGDQPEAITQLVDGVIKGKKAQILLGATGTGKTYLAAFDVRNANPKKCCLLYIESKF